MQRKCSVDKKVISWSLFLLKQSVGFRRVISVIIRSASCFMLFIRKKSPAQSNFFVEKHTLILIGANIY